MGTTTNSTAIVIGGSMAGLLAARVLSDRVAHVTVIERDPLPAQPAWRRGVPQGAHAHVLLGRGQRMLDAWFPGLSGELLSAGATPLRAEHLIWHEAGGHRARAESGFIAMGMSRPLLEHTVRTRLVESCPNVTVLDGVKVTDLITENGVEGVVAGGEYFWADLVVDCSGRASRTLDGLARKGYDRVDLDEVVIDVDYSTRTVPRLPRDVDGSAVVVLAEGARGRCAATMTPIEGQKWIVTQASFHAGEGARDDVAFEWFARRLPSSEIADVVDAAAPGAVSRFAMRASRRRRVERLRTVPSGFVVLGDALCSFNPVYGQGMTAAALQAQALGRALDRRPIRSVEFVRDYYRRTARVVDQPWMLAAVADFADPRTTGAAPRGTRRLIPYHARLSRAAHTSSRVATSLLRVQNMLAPTRALLSPGMLLRAGMTSTRTPEASAETRRADVARPGAHGRLAALRAGAVAGGEISRAMR